MRKSLFDRSRDIFGGILESRMVARMETEGRRLSDEETIEECKYILETVDCSGREFSDISKIKRACKYILKAGEKL